MLLLQRFSAVVEEGCENATALRNIHEILYRCEIGFLFGSFARLGLPRSLHVFLLCRLTPTFTSTSPTSPPPELYSLF